MVYIGNIIFRTFIILVVMFLGITAFFFEASHIAHGAAATPAAAPPSAVPLPSGATTVATGTAAGSDPADMASGFLTRSIVLPPQGSTRGPIAPRAEAAATAPSGRSQPPPLSALRGDFSGRSMATLPGVGGPSGADQKGAIAASSIGETSENDLFGSSGATSSFLSRSVVVPSRSPATPTVPPASATATVSPAGIREEKEKAGLSSTALQDYLKTQYWDASRSLFDSDNKNDPKGVVLVLERYFDGLKRAGNLEIKSNKSWFPITYMLYSWTLEVLKEATSSPYTNVIATQALYDQLSKLAPLLLQYSYGHLQGINLLDPVDMSREDSQFFVKGIILGTVALYEINMYRLPATISNRHVDAFISTLTSISNDFYKGNDNFGKEVKRDVGTQNHLTQAFLISGVSLDKWVFKGKHTRLPEDFFKRYFGVNDSWVDVPVKYNIPELVEKIRTNVYENWNSVPPPSLELHSGPSSDAFSPHGASSFVAPLASPTGDTTALSAEPPDPPVAPPAPPLEETVGVDAAISSAGAPPPPPGDSFSSVAAPPPSSGAVSSAAPPAAGITGAALGAVKLRSAAARPSGPAVAPQTVSPTARAFDAKALQEGKRQLARAAARGPHQPRPSGVEGERGNLMAGIRSGAAALTPVAARPAAAAAAPLAASEEDKIAQKRTDIRSYLNIILQRLTKLEEDFGTFKVPYRAAFLTERSDTVNPLVEQSLGIVYNNTDLREILKKYLINKTQTGTSLIDPNEYTPEEQKELMAIALAGAKISEEQKRRLEALQEKPEKVKETIKKLHDELYKKINELNAGGFDSAILTLVQAQQKQVEIKNGLAVLLSRIRVNVTGAGRTPAAAAAAAAGAGTGPGRGAAVPAAPPRYNIPHAAAAARAPAKAAAPGGVGATAPRVTQPPSAATGSDSEEEPEEPDDPDNW